MQQCPSPGSTAPGGRPGLSPRDGLGARFLSALRFPLRFAEAPSDCPRAIKVLIALVAAITTAAACWLWVSGRVSTRADVPLELDIERTSVQVLATVRQATVRQATVQQQWCKVCTSIKLEEMPEDAYACAERLMEHARDSGPQNGSQASGSLHRLHQRVRSTSIRQSGHDICHRCDHDAPPRALEGITDNRTRFNHKAENLLTPPRNVSAWRPADRWPGLPNGVDPLDAAVDELVAHYLSPWMAHGINESTVEFSPKQAGAPL